MPCRSAGGGAGHCEPGDGQGQARTKRSDIRSVTKWDYGKVTSSICTQSSPSRLQIFWTFEFGVSVSVSASTPARAIAIRSTRSLLVFYREIAKSAPPTLRSLSRPPPCHNHALWPPPNLIRPPIRLHPLLRPGRHQTRSPSPPKPPPTALPPSLW